MLEQNEHDPLEMHRRHLSASDWVAVSFFVVRDQMRVLKGRLGLDDLIVSLDIVIVGFWLPG